MATGGETPESSPSRQLNSALPQVGDRIQFTLNSQTLEGKVGFAGETEFAPGKWIGVILDGPFGKNNGSVKEKQYFTCKPQHGLFVRPQNIVQVLDGKPLRRKSNSASRSSLLGRRQSQSEVKTESASSDALPSSETLKDLKNAQEELTRQEREAEKLLAEVSCLRQQLEVEQRLQQAKSNDIEHLERALQQERQTCASLQQDWRAAQNLAEEARAELLRATRAQIEQAKEIETVSLTASQKQAELLKELEDLRLELSEERRLHVKEREGKSEERKSNPGPVRKTYASWTDFFMSQMCCSRGGTLVPVAEDTTSTGLRLETPGSGEAPM